MTCLLNEFNLFGKLPDKNFLELKIFGGGGGKYVIFRPSLLSFLLARQQMISYPVATRVADFADAFNVYNVI